MLSCMPPFVRFYGARYRNASFKSSCFSLTKLLMIHTSFARGSADGPSIGAPKCASLWFQASALLTNWEMSSGCWRIMTWQADLVVGIKVMTSPGSCANLFMTFMLLGNGACSGSSRAVPSWWICCVFYLAHLSNGHNRNFCNVFCFINLCTVMHWVNQTLHNVPVFSPMIVHN